MEESNAEVEARLAAQLLALGEDDASPADPMAYTQEIGEAARIKDRARQVVGSALEGVREGKPVVVGPVEGVVREILDSIHRNPDAMLSLSMLKKRDDYTYLHSVNMGVLLVTYCREMEMEEEEIIAVGLGGMLHDIGKMRISSRILDKPGSLLKQEWLQVKRHVELGQRLLERTPGIKQVSLEVASQHHERLDGSGYPNRLKGEAITRIGQMSAIVDIYDAITSSSSYRKGKDPHLVLKQMMGWRGTLLENALLQKFVHCVGVYPIGSLVRLKNGLIGVVIASNPGALLEPVVNLIIDARKKVQIEPRVVDLLIHKGQKEGGYQIEKLESLKEWKVNPRQFMPMPDCFK
ncbi:MAG: HD-GYP domain-containing protein [Magnetococcales bacterium]|nr:HD-GYP domain-containing protein [Magnetococcales bacterium]